MDHNLADTQPPIPPPRSDARVRRSREALRTAMLRLLVRQPLDAISIRALTAEAGVGYATFFRHFPTREALLEDAAASAIRQLVALAMDRFDAEGAERACQALCLGIAAEQALWRALLLGAQETVRAELIRISRELAPARSSGWPPQEIGIIVAVGAMVDILAWWQRQSPPLPPGDAADLLWRLVVRPAVGDRA